MSKKWDYKTTNQFIQLYKTHPCLWDLNCPDFKDKYKREMAYISIVREMNIPKFGIQEVKNKIKNLRSTYNQEIKKVQDSIKAGPGLTNIYTPSIKWLPEMDEVFMNLKKKPEGIVVKVINEESSEEDVDPQEEMSPMRPRKRGLDPAEVSFGKPPNVEVYSNNSTTETAFDMFGKSVAMQLKAMSVENGLLAQCKIQSILTEYGITDHRQKTDQRTSPEYLDETDVSDNDGHLNPLHLQGKRCRRLD